MLRLIGDAPGASGEMPDTDRRLPDVCSVLIRTLIGADQKGQAHRGSWVGEVGQERSGVTWECPERGGNVRSGLENHMYPDITPRLGPRVPSGWRKFGRRSDRRTGPEWGF